MKYKEGDYVVEYGFVCRIVCVEGNSFGISRGAASRRYYWSSSPQKIRYATKKEVEEDLFKWLYVHTGSIPNPCVTKYYNQCAKEMEEYYEISKE